MRETLNSQRLGFLRLKPEEEVNKGDVSAASVSSTTVPINSVSASDTTRYVSDTGAPIELSFTSQLTVSEWRDLLSDQENVNQVSKSGNTVTIELARGSYSISVAVITVEQTAQPSVNVFKLYDRDTSKTVQDGGEVTLEPTVFDEYGNGFGGKTVYAQASSGTLQPTRQVANTDGSAPITFIDTTADSQVTVQMSTTEANLGSGFDPSKPENLEYTITIEESGDSGGSSDGGNEPVPSIDRTESRQTSGGPSSQRTYDITIDWSATDDNELSGGSVNEIRVFDSEDNKVATAQISPSGTSDSGSETVSVTGQDRYTIEIIVSDSADQQGTDTKTISI